MEGWSGMALKRHGKLAYFPLSFRAAIAFSGMSSSGFKGQERATGLDCCVSAMCWASVRKGLLVELQQHWKSVTCKLRASSTQQHMLCRPYLAENVVP